MLLQPRQRYEQISRDPLGPPHLLMDAGIRDEVKLVTHQVTVDALFNGYQVIGQGRN